MSRGEHEPWIAADEPPAVEVVNPNGRGRVILTCDHASRRIPRRLGNLGLTHADLERHIAWDIGAAAVARRLSSILDAPLVLSGYSRLVVDCNRSLSVPAAFASRSEDVDVPGNQELTELERSARTEAFFRPYHDAINDVVTSRMNTAVPVVVSVHSFTPLFHGERRPWDVAVLSRLDKRLATLALEHLSAGGNLRVGDNEPYVMTGEHDYTIPVHAERHGLPHMLVEIRQDHIESERGMAVWAERLGALLTGAMEHPNTMRFGDRASDVDEPRYAQRSFSQC